jgi:serine/threonine-protein kinase PknG
MQTNDPKEPQGAEKEPAPSPVAAAGVGGQSAMMDEAQGGARAAVMQAVRTVLLGQEGLPSREDLQNASRELKQVAPYNYEAWRLHADLLLNALQQLETRQIQPDVNFKLLAVALREDDLREAAEAALRQCASYADSAEKHTALVDEANRIRRLTWF